MEFEATKWWKVLDSEGNLWCETSVKDEARQSMRPGDSLFQLFQRVELEWRKDPDGREPSTEDPGLTALKEQHRKTATVYPKRFRW